MANGELRTIRFRWSIDKLFKLIFTHFSNIFVAGNLIPTEYPATERSEVMREESRGNPSRGSAETENTSELLQDVAELLQVSRRIWTLLLWSKTNPSTAICHLSDSH